MNWSETSLGQVADINPRSRDWTTLPPETPVSFVPMSAISQRTASITETVVRPLAEVRKGFTPFRDNDVLFAKITPCMENGKAALATNLHNGIGFGSTEFHVLRARGGNLPKFIYYFVRQSEFRMAAKQRFRGAAGQQRVPEDFLTSYPFPEVAPKEQQRIVEFLEQADVLRYQRAEADQLADRILPSLFQQFFGDPATNPKKWLPRKLEEAGATVRYGLGQPPKSTDEGLPLLRATNLHRGQIFTDNLIRVRLEDIPPGRNAILKAEEVIVVRSGAYTGDVAQVTEAWEGAVAGYDLVINPGKSLVGEFLESYLLTEFVQKGYFENIKARAGQPHLNADQVGKTPIFEPPKPLQERFAKHVKSLRAQRIQRQHSLENLNALFATMLQSSFTGELTARWRQAHMKELLAEMEQQARLLHSTTNGRN
jgi:type I restriction enzyme S subunit